MRNANRKSIKPVVTVNKNDKRFYRKRIYDLTKISLSSDAKPLPSDIQTALDHYINACIDHFKMSDISDINQGDYDQLSNDTIPNCVEPMNENADKLMMRQVNIKKSSLDAFVTKTTKKKPILLPRTKDINLKDPNLMNKGISKKKNITSKYEETNGTETIIQKEEPTQENKKKI